MNLEKLLKLVHILESKAENMYKDEDGYNFVVTTSKALYKIDVIMDRGEFMSINIDVYSTNNDIWDHCLLQIQWDLNRYDQVLTYASHPIGNKILNALIAKLQW